MKQESITIDGEVIQELGNSMFSVLLDGVGETILCHISGKIRQNRVRILAGDKVKVELSPYDLTRGRICYRYKVGNQVLGNNNINNKNKNKK
jgi:translation initiation factor IF-1